MLSWFFRRTVDLKSHLRQTKKIRLKGIDFEIKKVGMDEHLAGLNVILQMHSQYQKEKPKDPKVLIDDSAKLKKFMKDFIYAGVVSPKLSIAKDGAKPDETHVDELLTDDELAQALCMHIINFAYGKKK